MGHRRFEHTADIGLEVWAADRIALFGDAAVALTEQITDPNQLSACKQQAISIDGIDWPDLMVNWLREVLYLWNGRRLLVQQVRIEHLAPFQLKATLACDVYDARRHRIRTEIKAVTYHQIRVAPDRTGWRAKIVLDV